MTDNKVRDFYKENNTKFSSKRQASKYLNGFGSVWKQEHNISLNTPKRGGNEIEQTPKSLNKKVNKGKK